jgi:hypothetical protein
MYALMIQARISNSAPNFAKAHRVAKSLEKLGTELPVTDSKGAANAAWEQ